jgi:hypothetical protein
MRRDLSGFAAYVERNSKILSTLVVGYESPEIALNCGAMLREVKNHFNFNKFEYGAIVNSVISRFDTIFWQVKYSILMTSGRYVSGTEKSFQQLIRLESSLMCTCICQILKWALMPLQLSKTL